MMMPKTNVRALITATAMTKPMEAWTSCRRNRAVGRRALGRRWSVGGRSFLVLTPSIRDAVGSVRRQAQIIGPKDAASLIWNCDIKAGDVVVEVGAGSGALTLVLAQAVGPGGHVVTYDMRSDFLDRARENVAAAGLGERVEFKLGDGRAAIPETRVDAFVVDIPDPWEAVR